MKKSKFLSLLVRYYKTGKFCQILSVQNFKFQICKVFGNHVRVSTCLIWNGRSFILEYIHKCCETGIQNFFKRKKNTQRLLSFFVCLCACKGSLASASAKLELAKKCPEYLGHLSIIPLMRHAQCIFWHFLDISIFPYFFHLFPEKKFSKSSVKKVFWFLIPSIFLNRSQNCLLHLLDT